MIEPEDQSPTTTPAGADLPPLALADVPGKEPATEFGGPAGLEPTRYGDWERRGRCIDF